MNKQPDGPITTLPPLGAIRSVQVPGGHIQLGKVVDNRMSHGMWFTLIRWIDVRRDAEWVPSYTVPPGQDATDAAT